MAILFVVKERPAAAGRFFVIWKGDPEMILQTVNFVCFLNRSAWLDPVMWWHHTRTDAADGGCGCTCFAHIARFGADLISCGGLRGQKNPTGGVKQVKNKASENCFFGFH